MAGGKKKTKSKGRKKGAPRGAGSPVKAQARPKNAEGDQDLDDTELDDVFGGGDVARSGDAKETKMLKLTTPTYKDEELELTKDGRSRERK